MKKLKYSLSILLAILIGSISAHAQILRKLDRRAQRSIEQAVYNKAEEKGTEKANEAIDQLIEKSINNMFEQSLDSSSGKGISSIDPSTLPDSYEFEWMYTMQMQTNDGLLNLDYFLKPKATYFGIKPDMQKAETSGLMFMVMDGERNINTIFMDMNGSKMAMPSSMTTNLDFESNTDAVSSEFTIKEIGTKTILGYACQGYKIESEESISTIYLTTEAPVSFSQLFNAENNNLPNNFNPKWVDKLENSLLMEMEYTNKDDKNNVIRMTCISLRKNAFSINKNDYQFMNINIPTSNNK